jgi:hypothetical protein
VNPPLSNETDIAQPFEIGHRAPGLVVVFADENKRAVFPYIHMLLPRQRENEILIPFSIGEIRIRVNRSFSDSIAEFMGALADCTLTELRHNKDSFSITVLVREGDELNPF